MTHQLCSKIVATGHYLPSQCVSNTKLSESVETSDEWIQQRTGIEQRYFSAKKQTTSDMAAEAAKEALVRAEMTANDIDLLIVATATPDLSFPSTAVCVQHKIGMSSGLAYDVAAACSGYLVALSIADAQIKSGMAQTVMIVGAEKMSSLLNMEDRVTCVLFGDGAAAIVLQATEKIQKKQGVLDFQLHSDGRFIDLLKTTGGVGSTGDAGRIVMSGQDVFKHAVLKLADCAEAILQKNDIAVDEIDWMVPHQANRRIIKATADRLKFSEDKIIYTVQDHANTSAASIPLALHVAIVDGRIKRDDLILHEAFGAGFVWGSCLVYY